MITNRQHCRFTIICTLRTVLWMWWFYVKSHKKKHLRISDLLPLVYPSLLSLLPTEQFLHLTILAELRILFMPFDSFSTKTLNLFGFPNFWLSAYMLKVIPETRRVYKIRYLHWTSYNDHSRRLTVAISN